MPARPIALLLAGTVLSTAVLSATVLSAAGCLTERLEAPFVLTAGVGEAVALGPTGRHTMLVASDSGLWEVAGDGTLHRLHDEPTHSVSANPEQIFTLTHGGTLDWGPLPALGSPWTPSATRPAEGSSRLQAWCDGDVMIARGADLSLFDPQTGKTTHFGTASASIVDVNLAAGEPCAAALVATAQALEIVSPTGTSTLIDDQSAIRATATDRSGRIWMVHGDPPVLSRITDDGPVLVARHLGDPRDLIFGGGGLFMPANAYLADGGGSVDYLRVPE